MSFAKAHVAGCSSSSGIKNENKGPIYFVAIARSRSDESERAGV